MVKLNLLFPLSRTTHARKGERIENSKHIFAAVGGFYSQSQGQVVNQVRQRQVQMGNGLESRKGEYYRVRVLTRPTPAIPPIRSCLDQRRLDPSICLERHLNHEPEFRQAPWMVGNRSGLPVERLLKRVHEKTHLPPGRGFSQNREADWSAPMDYRHCAAQPTGHPATPLGFCSAVFRTPRHRHATRSRWALCWSHTSA